MTLSVLAGAVQLTVPAYALRLVRRFGTQRIGWFLVTTFVCLALLHLLSPLGPIGAGPFSGVMPEAIYALGSLFLLVGLAHAQTLVVERDHARGKAETLSTRSELRVKKETADLAKANEELRAEIARREQTEKSIRESEAQYRFLFTENPQPMCIIDLRSCRFLAVNHAALRLYGFTEPEFLALTARDLVPPAAAPDFLRDANKPCPGAEPRGLWQHCRKDRTLIDVELTAIDFRYRDASARLILATDVTQRRRCEVESRQTQRTELIGQVATGVAHHFNDILTVFAGHVALLQQKPQDATSAEQLNRVSAEVNRAVGIYRQLLAAGGRQQARLEPLDVNGLIRKLKPMLGRLLGGQIVLQDFYGSGVPALLADRHLVEHIIVHLTLNAREAMPTGGTLTISTKTVAITEAQARIQQIKPGDYVRLNVVDTGCGMSPEVKARLFEPFFTTKNTGRTVGLGLASVSGAARQMAGWVEFDSEVGVGTEFRVFLPCAREASGPTQAGALAATPTVLGTILLLIPEDRLRHFARCVLHWNDYRVIEADCGTMAMTLWQDRARKVDLLLTESSLPDGATGQALADRFRQTNPHLKVIHLLDPGQDPQAQTKSSRERQNFIRKPFRPATLLQAVQSCLAEES